MSTLKVSIFSLDGPAYEGEARNLNVPASDGSVGILPGHAPMIAILKTGITRILDDKGEHFFITGNGYVETVGHEAILMVRHGVPVTGRDAAEAFMKEDDPLKVAAKAHRQRQLEAV